MKKAEKNKRISFTAIAVSFVFLFNPCISIIDVLPDLIGYVILVAALTRLADLNDTFFEVQRRFKFLIAIDALKLFALFWCFVISSGNERSASLLLWSFVFAVLDVVFLIPALSKLFAGMAELGLLYESSYVIEERIRRNGTPSKNPTDRIRALSVAFVAFKAIVTVLPEFTELTASYYRDLQVSGATVNLYRYVGALRFLAVLLILAFGIVWLISVIGYFARVKRDKSLLASLEQAYEEKVLVKKGLFIKRRTAFAGYLVLAAVVASFDLRFDGVNILPDLLAVPLLVAAFLLLGRVVSVKKTKGIILGVAGAVCSIAYYVSDLLFQKSFYNNGIEIIWRDTRAMTLYVVMLTLSVLSTTVFVLLIAFVLGCYNDVIAVAAEVDTQDDHNARLVLEFAEENKNRLNLRLLVCFIAVVIYAVTDICYAAFSKAAGAMFMFNTVGAIAVFITFLVFHNLLRDIFRDKYKFE